MHSVLDEIVRARLPIRPEVLARWQRAIRNDIAPALAERAEVTVTVDGRALATASLPSARPRHASR